MENDFTGDEVNADSYREYFTEEYTVISTEACYEHCQQGASFITLKVLIRTRSLILSLIPKIYLPLTHVTFGGKGPTAVLTTKYV